MDHRSASPGHRRKYQAPAILIEASYSAFATLLVTPDARVLMMWGPPWTCDALPVSSSLRDFPDRLAQMATADRTRAVSQTLLLSPTQQ
jgi:hypothetical protein